MTTADWALIISIISAITSIAGFVWNVWSKFIYPKPKVNVTAGIYAAPGATDDDDHWLLVTATNLGPGPVTLRYVIGQTYRNWRLRRMQAIFLPLANPGLSRDYTEGPLSGGLPKTLDPAASFTCWLSFPHEGLEQTKLRGIGFSDSFGRLHLCSRADMKRIRSEVRNTR